MKPPTALRIDAANERLLSFHRLPPGGAVAPVLTAEGLLVELHKVGEDVFRDGLLIRETLEQNDHLRLANGVHALSRHVPTLPVYICGFTGQKSIVSDVGVLRTNNFRFPRSIS